MLVAFYARIGASRRRLEVGHLWPHAAETSGNVRAYIFETNFAERSGRRGGGSGERSLAKRPNHR
jgi:hypothetical protein